MSNEEGNNRSRIGWYDSDSDANLDSTALTSSPVPGETCAGDGPVVEADISASPQQRNISELFLKYQIYYYKTTRKCQNKNNKATKDKCNTYT